MTWGNPPKFKPDPPKKGKKITPEDLAASGSEDGHQAALFCWAADEVIAGRYPQLQWMFAIPNGGSRHIAEATKFVGTGTRSGVPDIFLPCVSGRAIGPKYYGCFIEMKHEKYRRHHNGGAKLDQIEYMEYLAGAGYYCKVCYSWTEARDTLITYLEGKL